MTFHEGVVHPVGADPARGDGPTQGQEPPRLLGVGDRHLLEDADGALTMVLLHFHVHVPDLVVGQLAGADHPEEPVVKPRVGVPRRREERPGELPWCNRHDVSPPGSEGGDREASVYSS